MINNNSEKNDLVILEGTISVLSAIYSEYCEVIKIIIKSGKDKNDKNAGKIIRAADKNNIIIEYMLPDKFDLLALGKTHGGVIAYTKKRRYLTPEKLFAQSKSIAIIEGIEDPFNLGYAVRALYTQGIDGLIIPERDFGASEAVIEKASTGTFYKMPAAVFSDKLDLIKIIKDNKFKIYCIDKQPESREIFKVKFAEKLVFIIGGEKRGISRDFLNNADEIVSIPYARAFPHSLAAQTAATIIAYEIHRQKHLASIIDK